MNEKEELVSKDDNWEITTNRYVVYIDIMGFKDMVARRSHLEIYEMMKRIENKKNIYENINWVDNDSKFIRTTNYSDSIMIYTKDDSKNSLRSLVATVSALSNSLFIDGIPHKGAFAFGMMTLDTVKSIFFGQPLIDAYLLQEELNFYGIIGHASAQSEINLKEFSSFFLFNYLCPLKKGNSKHLTIFPINAYINKENKEEDEVLKLNLVKAIDKLRHSTSGYLRTYIDNTETYINEVNNSK